MFKNHTACRVCGNENLIPYLDLGLMPLSNNLLTDPQEIAPRYPLKVLFCENCGLSQLSVVVDPETLFSHYVYRSSISEGYKNHCREMAREICEDAPLAPFFHIDIAGNDGALLNEFKQVFHSGYKCLNIDPAENLEKFNEEKGIRYFKTFWGLPAAKHLIQTGWPKADLITATNVFAHVDNVEEFLLAAKTTLAKDGVLIIEFPYLIDFIEKNEFDTVYFEHLSYFSISPLNLACIKAGLRLFDVRHFDIHGGSVRCYITHTEREIQVRNNVTDYILKEAHEDFDKVNKYKKWGASVAHVVKNFVRLMNDLRNRKVYGFAASAKGNTLLNVAGINISHMPFIIDQTPEKIGKYSPGTNIPIADMDQLVKDQPDYLVILSWNFSDEIISKCKKAGYAGKFIHPLTCEVL